MKKVLIFTLISGLFMLSGCVKETYQMDKLSKMKQLSPSVILPVFKGNIVMSDALKNIDTVIYDSDKFVRLIFKNDSVFDKGINDLYDTENIISFTNSYTLGDVSINPFQGTLSMSLDQISRNFSPALRSTFVSLDNGLPHPFPQFTAVSMPITAFSTFANLQSATFSSGFLDLSVTNNLTAPLNNIIINLSNSYGPVAGPITLPAIQPGETKTIAVDLTGKTLTNALAGTITFSGSPGNASPVIIDLDNSFVTFMAKGRSLQVKSGRIIIPSQVISDPGSTDTVSIEPGEGIELQQVKMTGGLMTWQTNSSLPLYATLNLTFPGITRNPAVYNQTINIVPNQLINGNVSATNMVIDLSKDLKQPYNRIPIAYSIQVTSNNSLIDFKSTDQIKVRIDLDKPQFEYLKGYFGQKTATFGEDLYLGIDQILNSIKGKFSITDPRLRINYTNSFGIPSKFNFRVTGIRGDQSVVLDLNNITIAIPDFPTHHDATGSLEINKNNSSISQLISLPPGKFVYQCSVTMNPAGDPSHLRNNYLFGDSRINISTEIEVPLEMSFNNFQFSDTTDNFLKDLESDPDIGPINLGISIQNGLPFDVSAALSLCENNVVKSTIEVPSLIKSGTIGSNGTVTAKTNTESTVSFTKDFLDKAHTANKIVISFKVNTPGSQNVKIYSDYSIGFTLTISGKPVIKL